MSAHDSPSLSTVPGSRWWRVDFHTHTPHSTDYRNRAVTSRDWLVAHMRAGIDVVCVTDHNGGGFINDLKAEYSRILAESIAGTITDFRPLVIFPGVELTTAEDIHLLAIFGPDKDGSAISSLLGEVGIQGRQEGDAALQLRDGIKTILENAGKGAFDCIFIPAHVNGPKGLITDGNARAKLEVLAHTAIYALECSWNTNFDWAAEIDPVSDSQNKVFSTVYGSDSHDLSEIGRRSTWVRMEAPTLDGLRIALMDGDGVVAEYNPSSSMPGPPDHLWIEEILLTKAKHLDPTTPLRISLNPGLNTVIGGRGSGKSTILELVRKATYRSDDLGSDGETDLRVQHDSLVEEALNERPDAEIQVTYVRRGQKSRFVLKGSASPLVPELHSHDPAAGWTQSNLPHYEWRGLYPLRIYSQKELYGFRKGTAKLLAEIDADPSIGRATWQDEFDNLFNAVLQHSIKETELKLEQGKLPGLLARREDLAQQLSALESAGQKEVLQAFNLRRTQQAEITRWDDPVQKLVREIDDLANKLSVSSLRLSRLPGSVDEVPEVELETAAETVRKAFEAAKAALEGIGITLTEAKEKWNEDRRNSKWSKALEEARRAYEALAALVTPEQAANPGIYGQLVQQLESIDSQLNAYREQERQLVETTRDKELKHADLEKHREKISEKREQFLQRVFADRSDIKISLVRFGDKDDAKRRLREVLQRLDSSPELEELVEKLYSQTVTTERLRTFKQALEEAAAIADRHESFEGVVLGKALCSHLSKRTTEDWVRLKTWFPSDNLKIKVSRDGETAPNVDLGRASPGQVATAVLAFLLAYGDQPLILDQPEDDLDNEMIFKIIVNELRRNKRRRQVILVTHNPNLVVNANADMIFPLNSSQGPTRLPHSGTLQQPEVRNLVCALMEGGKRALVQRFRRMV